MRTIAVCRWVVAASAVASIIGCAHRDPDPFIYGPEGLGRERATPPECFTAPLTDCIGDPGERSALDHLASPWREDFEPDLAARICRGDGRARQRWLEGARRLGADDPRESVYLEILDRCSEAEYCGWTMDVAASQGEAESVRRILLESARRWCAEEIEPEALERVGLEIGVPLANKAPWITNSQQKRCAEHKRHEEPWQDMVGLQAAGCLDLGEWIEHHHRATDATAAALESCVVGSEIRYQEANCLRELAGLDRGRAVALVRADDRRGWGISSTITRYARILNRFPGDGDLEAELVRLELIPDAPPPPVVPGKAPVLAQEILEHWGRSAFFNPGCSVRYCEHAPLMYELMGLVSPALDDVILEERWPALEGVDLGSGPRRVSTTIGAIPVRLHVAEGEGGGFDRDDHDRLRDAISSAREQPHVLVAYSEGRANRMRLRNLGEWYDLEVLLAGLNTLLADRGSELRYITLDPHCVPCAVVVAGPGSGLIEAAFDGLIEVTDPFKELWAQPGFVLHPTP
jgi:hypothetical protein